MQVGEVRAVEAEISLNEIQVRLEEFVHAVEQGHVFVITRGGNAVAKLVPVEGTRVLTPGRVLTPEQQAARERARERMQKGIDLGGPSSTAMNCTNADNQRARRLIFVVRGKPNPIGEQPPARGMAAGYVLNQLC